jgi:hypothetical protein
MPPLDRLSLNTFCFDHNCSHPFGLLQPITDYGLALEPAGKCAEAMGRYAADDQRPRMGSAALLPELAPMRATVPGGDDGVSVKQIRGSERLGRAPAEDEAQCLSTLRRSNPVVENILGVCSMYSARQALHYASAAETSVTSIPEHGYGHDASDSLVSMLEDACRAASKKLLRQQLEADEAGGSVSAEKAGAHGEKGAQPMDTDSDDFELDTAGDGKKATGRPDLDADMDGLEMDSPNNRSKAAGRRGDVSDGRSYDVRVWVAPVEPGLQPATAAEAALRMRQSVAVLGAHVGFLGTSAGPGDCCWG